MCIAPRFHYEDPERMERGWAFQLIGDVNQQVFVGAIEPTFQMNSNQLKVLKVRQLINFPRDQIRVSCLLDLRL